MGLGGREVLCPFSSVQGSRRDIGVFYSVLVLHKGDWQGAEGYFIASHIQERDLGAKGFR